MSARRRVVDSRRSARTKPFDCRFDSRHFRYTFRSYSMSFDNRYSVTNPDTKRKGKKTKSSSTGGKRKRRERKRDGVDAVDAERQPLRAHARTNERRWSIIETFLRSNTTVCQRSTAVHKGTSRRAGASRRQRRRRSTHERENTGWRQIISRDDINAMRQFADKQQATNRSINRQNMTTMTRNTQRVDKPNTESNVVIEHKHEPTSNGEDVLGAEQRRRRTRGGTRWRAAPRARATPRASSSAVRVDVIRIVGDISVLIVDPFANDGRWSIRFCSFAMSVNNRC